MAFLRDGGTFPNQASVTRLIGAVLCEKGDERQTANRYMMVGAFAQLGDEVTDPVFRINAGRSLPQASGNFGRLDRREQLN